MINITIAGENALIIYFAEEASDETAAIVYQAESLIRCKMPNDFIDLIPSYASILVMFDMRDIDHNQLRQNLRSTLAGLSSNKAKGKQESLVGNLVELPVYYSEQSGPDLARIASTANLSIEDVIHIHQAQEYRVFAIGFAPGFAYLGEVDSCIAMPRLATPRLKVPEGAVAIADRQTAVYPSVSPGGWNIIGLCPVSMFNPSSDNIMPVKVGDRVKFKAISKHEFITLGGSLINELADELDSKSSVKTGGIV
jgi:KipI family sensor histidine kinase inhibitor